MSAVKTDQSSHVGSVWVCALGVDFITRHCNVLTKGKIDIPYRVGVFQNSLNHGELSFYALLCIVSSVTVSTVRLLNADPFLQTHDKL